MTDPTRRRAERRVSYLVVAVLAVIVVLALLWLLPFGFL